MEDASYNLEARSIAHLAVYAFACEFGLLFPAMGVAAFLETIGLQSFLIAFITVFSLWLIPSARWLRRKHLVAPNSAADFSELKSLHLAFGVLLIIICACLANVSNDGVRTLAVVFESVMAIFYANYLLICAIKSIRPPKIIFLGFTVVVLTLAASVHGNN